MVLEVVADGVVVVAESESLVKVELGQVGVISSAVDASALWGVAADAPLIFFRSVVG